MSSWIAASPFEHPCILVVVVPEQHNLLHYNPMTPSILRGQLARCDCFMIHHASVPSMLLMMPRHGFASPLLGLRTRSFGKGGSFGVVVCAALARASRDVFPATILTDVVVFAAQRIHKQWTTPAACVSIQMKVTC